MINKRSQRRKHSLSSIAGAVVIVLLATVAARAQWTNPDLNQNINSTNTGNVGIGTPSPSTKLEVNKSQNAGTAITVDNGHTGASNAAFSGIWFKQAGANRFVIASNNDNNSTQNGGPGGVMFWNFANGPTLFATNNTEQMRITPAGYVGIGITSPLYSLDVNGGTNGFRTKASSAAANDTIATFENSSAIQMIVRANGNVGIGTINPANKLHVNGSITIENGNINAKYQDLAEWVESSQQLTGGTVVVLDPDKNNQVVAATQSYDSRVAGVISVQPGIALGEHGEGRVLVATTGRVKVKVDATNGPIKIGDLLVTSDKEGFAMKSVPVEFGGVRLHRPGTLIGKALEPLANGTGEILVLLSLQ